MAAGVPKLFVFGAIQQDGTSVNGGKLRSLLGIDLQISARPFKLQPREAQQRKSNGNSGVGGMIEILKPRSYDSLKNCAA